MSDRPNPFSALTEADPAAVSVIEQPAAGAKSPDVLSGALSNCVQCHALLIGVPVFCGACGAEQKTTASTDATVLSPTPPPPPSSSEATIALEMPTDSVWADGGIAIPAAVPASPPSVPKAAAAASASPLFTMERMLKIGASLLAPKQVGAEPQIGGPAVALNPAKPVQQLSTSPLAVAGADGSQRGPMQVDLQTAIEDAYRVQRCNLLNLVKIGTKALIESHVGYASALGEDHYPLRQLCVLLEHIYKHGVKEKRSTFSQNKGYWGMLEALEKPFPMAAAPLRAAREIAALKTPHGRGRAWIRFSLQYKTLPDVTRALANDAAFVSEWYEPWAFMRQDEGLVFSGLLLGLRVIDCAFVIDAEKLDNVPGTIDYSAYLRDGNYLKQGEDRTVSASADERFSEASFVALQDQKSSLHENNVVLTKQLADMTAAHAAQAIEAEKRAAETVAMRAQIAALTRQVEVANAVALQAKEEFERKVRIAQDDIATERATYAQSRSGLDDLYHAIEKQLSTEQSMRASVELDLTAAHAKRDALEAAATGLHQQIAEKQQHIAALRAQLQEVKDLHVSMAGKAQDSQAALKAKDDEIFKLNRHQSALDNEIASLRERVRASDGAKMRLESTLLELTNRLTDIDSKRTELETNILIEKQWRASLQRDLQLEQERAAQLGPLKEALTRTEEELTALRGQHAELQRDYTEQELTLVDLGSHIAGSKLRLNDMEAKQKAALDKEWIDDSSATDCKGCQKVFNVTRRKHHCRKCGGVFCNSCSDQQMPLPSSAKPVRVCDRCQAELLKAMQG